MLTACSKESSSKKTTPNDDVIEQKMKMGVFKSYVFTPLLASAPHHYMLVLRPY